MGCNNTISKCVKHNPAAPVVHNGVEEYEVEQIIDSQVFRGRLEYLVHWKGYGIEEDEWRLAKDIKGSRQLVSEFHHRNPEAPQNISTLDFANLPFLPILNFTDTPDTVPSGWATGCHASGCCTFEVGVNVRVFPIKCPSNYNQLKPYLLSELTLSSELK